MSQTNPDKKGRSFAVAIAGEQSSRNWGSVRAQRRPLPELPLMLESIRLWETLEQSLETELDWRQQGQMRLCYDHEALEWAESWIPIGREHGLDTKVLTPSETATLSPHFAVNDLKGHFTPPPMVAPNRKK